MPVEARPVQVIIVRDMRRRLAGGEPAVDFGTLDMLACLTCSTQTHVDTYAGGIGVEKVNDF